MTHFDMYNILDRKKKGLELSEGEIKWVISNYMKDEVKDYQMSALLMALFINGMTTKETAYLTDAMLYSGTALSFDDKSIVDKHSTGGVGDKTSFIIAPIAAACGVKVPMIAGRGLGHTGGTVDKIEAIPGFKTDLSLNEFKTRLLKDGLVLIGQTKDIAPADKRIYALRDVTATIDSIPLITASIMSKKLAEGANGIVMDIKAGNGAFMRTKSEAKKLAKSILATAKRFDKTAVTLITNMSQPLGNTVGHSLELIECIEVLKGRGPKDLTELSLHLAAHMIQIAGIEKTFSKALKKAKLSIKDGTALTTFKNLIENQGGDKKVIDNYALLDIAECKTEVKSPRSGYIKSFQTNQIGFMCTELGGGRKVKTDLIDFGVGFDFHKKLSDKVKRDEAILTIYHRQSQKDLVADLSKNFVTNIIKLSPEKPARPEVIYDVLVN